MTLDNKRLEFWRSLGVTIIPHNTVKNLPVLKEWGPYQHRPPTDTEYQNWKDQHLFDNGAAAILGRAWGKKGLVGTDKDLEYYLWAIDIDSPDALQMIDFNMDLTKKSFLVEEHANTPGKYHIFGFSTVPIPSAKLVLNGKLILEVFGDSSHLINISPSMHEDGSTYKPVEGCTSYPEINDGIVDTLQRVFRRYDKKYFIDLNQDDSVVNPEIATDDPFEYYIYEGQRWLKLRVEIPKILRKYMGKRSLEDIKKDVLKFNQNRCKPPFPLNELEVIWNDSVELMKKDVAEHGKGTNEKVIMSDAIMQAAKTSIKKIFVDEYQIPHAAISVNQHLETIPIKSKRFRSYLARIVFEQHGIVVNNQAVEDVTNVLSANAEFDESSDMIKLNLRVAESEDGTKLYYDLTNKNWEFVEITSEGWKIINNQILFHRYTNQIPQVQPSREYPRNILDGFVALVLNENNIEDVTKLEEYQILVKCYIICTLMPGFPKTVNMPSGTQGGAKSTFIELIKMLIDPCVIKLLSFPQDKNELIQQLSHNYIANYDNVSKLQDWISDEICRAVSGSGSSKRILYSDDDDFIRNFMRCISINGINLAATKADLLDRSMFLRFKRIEPENRRYIKSVYKEFEQMKSQLLGYIFDTLVEVLKWKEVNGELDLAKIPRMADWAGQCEIIARCMGYKEGEFLKAYEENAKIQTEQVIETSILATCTMHFVETDPRFNGQPMVKDLEGKAIGWVGTATSLKAELETVAGLIGINTKSSEWPKDPARLGKKLNEILHTLKEAGVLIGFDTKTRGKRIIQISKLPLLPLLPMQTDSASTHEDITSNSNNSSNSKSGISLSDTELSAKNLSYRLMLVYKGSEFLNRLQAQLKKKTYDYDDYKRDYSL